MFQGIQELLILCLEHHDKAVWHDFAFPIFTHLAHNDVIQSSSEERALLTDHDDLGTHVLASLLNGEISLFIDVDD